MRERCYEGESEELAAWAHILYFTTSFLPSIFGFLKTHAGPGRAMKNKLITVFGKLDRVLINGSLGILTLCEVHFLAFSDAEATK
jgi:hypothetical protein